MTCDIQSVHADTPTSAVAAMLTSMAGDSSHVYVVDDDEKLLGVISPRDILRQLSDRLETRESNGRR